MILTHYDLTDLRVFLAVAEEGNLSRGARRCHLAPSSVSLRLKGLEESIGVPLLERQARGVALTRAGAVMLEHVRRCIAQLEQMHVDLQPFVEGLTGHLTLFANNNVMHSHLPQDLARFFQQYPSVRISLQERLGSDIIAAVADGRADLGIVAVDPDHPQLAFQPYREDEFVVIAPPGHALARHAAVRFVACFDQPFISLQGSTALHTYLMNQATALGGRLDVRVQVSNYSAVARLVASGAGIAVVPRSALDAPDRQHLAVIALSEKWAARHHRLCFRPEAMAANHYLRKLVEVLGGGATIDHG